MRDDSSNADPFGKLVDEYKDRLREGDKPSIEIAVASVSLSRNTDMPAMS